jgi:hypothetical protein
VVFNDILVSRKETKLASIKDRDFFINCPFKIRKPNTTRQEDFKINSTFISYFLVYLGLLKGDKFDSSIYRILISDFYYFYS